MIQLEYLTDQNGYKKAVVVPIDLWNSIFKSNEPSEEEMAEIMEDYCMNKAMDEAIDSPLMTRDEALAWLKVNRQMEVQYRKPFLKDLSRIHSHADYNRVVNVAFNILCEVEKLRDVPNLGSP